MMDVCCLCSNQPSRKETLPGHADLGICEGCAERVRAWAKGRSSEELRTCFAGLAAQVVQGHAAIAAAQQARRKGA